MTADLSYTDGIDIIKIDAATGNVVKQWSMDFHYSKGIKTLEILPE